jgi:AbiJ N-terminal domain 4
MKFSERYGYSPVRTAMQRGSMESSLRNRLWNVFHEHFLTISPFRSIHETLPPLKDEVAGFLGDYRGLSISHVSDMGSTSIEEAYERYFMNCDWFEVYDFIEFMAPMRGANFVRAINARLKEDGAGYRMLSGQMTEITSEEEIAEIEQAMSVPEKLKPIKDHLAQSLSLMSHRTKPDFRNSIKESISAVESACKLISNSDKATLDTALKALTDKAEIHGALKKAFSQLYGYTSDAAGIRHALMEESTLDVEDAKFMLVACSAFINYLIVKSQKAGIKI